MAEPSPEEALQPMFSGNIGWEQLKLELFTDSLMFEVHSVT